jgi:hypothetical protein
MYRRMSAPWSFLFQVSRLLASRAVFYTVHERKYFEVCRIRGRWRKIKALNSLVNTK